MSVDNGVESGVVHADNSVSGTRWRFDGLGRSDNLRYDAALDKLRLAASIGNGDKIEVAALYEIDNFKIGVGLWDEQDSGAGRSGNAISASWLGDSGFNVTAATGGDDRDGDPRNNYLKLGHKRGDHAYAIDWSETTDLGSADASSYSVAWVGLMMQGVELYATYQHRHLPPAVTPPPLRAVTGRHPRLLQQRCCAIRN